RHPSGHEAGDSDCRADRARGRAGGMNARLVVLALAAVCSACATAQLYDGPRRTSDEVARITGDMRINAGSPLTLILREVDNTPLNVGQNAVECCRASIASWSTVGLPK